MPTGGAGQLYNTQIQFDTAGGAALPDRFEIQTGVLPPGMTLVEDREDTDLDGLPDPDGALTGHVRLVGFPRDPGTYTFTVRAISTGAHGDPSQPDLACVSTFTVTVGQGSVNILNPEGQTIDPAVPAFPEVVDFVNPANPKAFMSFAFLIAGGSGSNIINVYVPRELELSTFDEEVSNGTQPVTFDTDESVGSGDKLENHFSDGGWFVLQVGDEKVQIGGFQSPRGAVGAIDQYAGGPGLDPDWFQRLPTGTGPARSSRRDLGDSDGLAGGDTTLGAAQPVLFSDYFDPRFEGTWSGFTSPAGATPILARRKYPFTSDQYSNAFFMPYTEGVDLTPLRFRLIVEAIDTRGTADKNDDLIARRAYAAQIKIPDIRIDTILLPGGQAGVDYTEVVAASGGVPPLNYKLEWVDGTLDLEATDPSPLTKADFGVEMDTATGYFFGIPRASGPTELTVVVSAAVLNPSQNGPAFVPTGASAGEYNGKHR